jgi:hypothetical protein
MKKVIKNIKKKSAQKKNNLSNGKTKKDKLKNNLIDDHTLEIDTEETIEEIELEENREFIKEIEIFEKRNRKAKIIKVFNFIGKPKITAVKDSDTVKLNQEYKNLISLLGEHKIVVHFQKEYPLKEKYRFITEDIMKQDIEDVKGTQLHINFIYEEFYPELMIGEDDEY